MKIGVAIGTYGNRDQWAPLVERAIRSVQSQTLHCEYQWIHGEALHTARNDAARKLIDRGCDWLIFLDADDELDWEYAALTSAYAEGESEGHVVIYTATIGIVDGVRDSGPHMNTPTDLLDQNFVTIGALHSVKLFNTIGGFDDWPILEDWAYWLKAHLLGARFIPCTSAVYEVNIDTTRISRNQGCTDFQIHEAFTNIRAMGRYMAAHR